MMMLVYFSMCFFKFSKMSRKNAKSCNVVQTQLRPSLQTTTTTLSEPKASLHPTLKRANFDNAAIKVELLTSLRKDIAEIFTKELQKELGDALSTITLNL